MTWLPIDDPERPAPKDGTMILLLFNRGLVSVAYWDAYCAVGGDGCSDGVAWTDPVSGERVHLYHDMPTHWMPLPPPPPNLKRV